MMLLKLNMAMLMAQINFCFKSHPLRKLKFQLSLI